MLPLSQDLRVHQNQKLHTHVLKKKKVPALWNTLTEKAIVELTELELPQNNKELSWIQMPREMHRIGKEKIKENIGGGGLGDASIRKEPATQA